MKNKNITPIKSRYSETSRILKNLEKAIKDKLEAKKIIKEEEVKYPDMENDIKEDIDNIKKGLSSYLITIDPKEGYKFYQGNVIMYGKVIIKGITFNFSYSLDEEGCLLYFPKDIDSIPLYNEIIQFMSDLKQYYLIWKNGWIDKMNSFNNK